ncbi:DUF402 domain-containing protein [Halosolutus amylolyticus]|uniref:Probable ribonuclease FAU-1 n=1 Tax=Halosolutus amylolyticus TaxID=2932267 RepID=A0ABD5PQQ0_9EURY|nr:DUF402 domain-containing protein [Halosolutus amylolyticus]
MTTVRVRGIYTTAVTHLLDENGFEVVQASDPIEERFDSSFEAVPADVSIETSRDRQGLAVSGAPDAVAAVVDQFDDLAIDTFHWDAAAPRGAVFDGDVIEADGGGGAVVDLGDGRRGYLDYDDVDGYVDTGNRYRLQVREPAPPWDDDRPRVAPSLEVQGGLCTLSRDRHGVSAALRGERADELVGMTDLLSTDIPEGWGLRWQPSAADADLDAMGTALDRAVDRAAALEDALADAPDDPGDPGRLAAPQRTVWFWFGRESRFALDDARRAVTATMAGHHRTKAADRAASAAVDFAEAVCGSARSGTEDDGDGDDSDGFPFAAVTGQFGPTTGDRIEIGHGKPDGRRISLGRGEVTDWAGDGSVTVERSMRGGGTYDALGVPKESGDVAVTKFREGRWWYPTTYRDAEGTAKGTYVNICTPVELFPDCARYVDLYVDVIRKPDGSVAIVDEDELESAVADGLVSEDLAEKATTVATAVERALSK